MKCEPASLSRSCAAKMAAISLVGLWVKRPHMPRSLAVSFGLGQAVVGTVAALYFRGGDDQVIVRFLPGKKAEE